MSQLKLKVKKTVKVKPRTQERGYTARILTNGTADFDDIVEDASGNTTMHKAELKMAIELCMDSIAKVLRQGFIVDLGPLGRIYPSCSSGWFEHKDNLKLASVKPQLYYRPSEEMEAAVRQAKLVWVKGDGDEDEEPATL